MTTIAPETPGPAEPTKRVGPAKKRRAWIALALWLGVLAFTLLYVYLLDHRYRLEVLDEDREERELEAAIADRVQGGTPSREAVGATS